MTHYLSIFLTICLIPCNCHSAYRNTLSQVESYIENRPDSALAVLEQMEPSKLSGKSERARHALLFSIALDKNFVNKTDFEVLQPAIDYYENKGTATDKLRTYYYKGRIYQNQGNDALAMECFLNAIGNGEESDDIVTKARLYVAKGDIYHALMKWEKVCEANLKAANYFFQAGDFNNYINSTLKAASVYTQNGKYSEAAKCLAKCKEYIDIIPSELATVYYSEFISYLIDIEDTARIKDAVSLYKLQIPDDALDYGTLANAYLSLGNYSQALESIHKIDRSSDIRYYAILSGIQQRLGNHKAALDAYRIYNKITDSLNLAAFDQDTQFVEERHALELENIKERNLRNKIILLTILICVILIAKVIYIRGELRSRAIRQAHAEQEAERYRLLYQQMECEKESLSEILSRSNDMDKDIKNIVAGRIELLNKFFTVSITNNSEISHKADKELEELLANKKTFMASTRLAFAGTHPNFIKYLKEHNLTEREIEYCCLYAIGLKGKEVGSYMKMRSHFNISSDIRRKLGLEESDTNLGIHIRKLLSAL